MLMRRHYSVRVQSTIVQRLSVLAYVRVDGDPAPGSTVSVVASVPNTSADQVPDSWNRLSSPRSVQVDPAGEIAYAGSNNDGAVTCSVRLSPDYARVTGAGSVRFRLWGMTFATPVSIVGYLYKTEETPDTSTVPAAFGTSLAWPAADARRKGSGIGVDAAGNIIDFLYDDQSRHDTWVRVNGKVIAHTDAETGNIFFTPDGRAWATFEKGITGRPSELINNSRLRDLGFDVHYCGCGIGLNGDPFFFDCAKGAAPVVRNIAGTVVTGLPGQGIPYDAEVDPKDPSAAYVTIQDGTKNGIAHTRSKAFIPGDVRAVVAYRGQVLAGVSGSVKVVGTNSFSEWSEAPKKLGDSVDAMCVDGRGILWISTSGPDALYCLVPGGKLTLVDSFADDADGGALFRTDVEAGGPGGTVVVWGRNNKRTGSRWEVRRVTPIGSASGASPGEAAPGTQVGLTEPVDLSTARWLGSPDGSKFPIVAGGTIKHVGSTTHFKLTAPLRGACSACVFVLRDGQIIGGAYDGCDSGETLVVKSRGNIKGGSKGGPLPARYGPTKNEQYNRAYLKLRDGETYWQCIVDTTNRVRTAAMKGVWEE